MIPVHHGGGDESAIMRDKKVVRMGISARVQNRQGQHQVSVSTNDNVQTLAIPPKATGFGSSVNGGELLFLALATCYCNDVYRGAAKWGIAVESVEVEVAGEFGSEGEPATKVSYREDHGPRRRGRHPRPWARDRSGRGDSEHLAGRDAGDAAGV
jgi:hypothetical protein